MLFGYSKRRIHQKLSMLLTNHGLEDGGSVYSLYPKIIIDGK